MPVLRSCVALVAGAFFFAPAPPETAVPPMHRWPTRVPAAGAELRARQRVAAGRAAPRAAEGAKRRADEAAIQSRRAPRRAAAELRQAMRGEAARGPAAPLRRTAALGARPVASRKSVWLAQQTRVSAVCAKIAPSSSKIARPRPAVRRSRLAFARVIARASTAIAARSTPLAAPTARQTGLASPQSSTRRAAACRRWSHRAPDPRRTRPWPSRSADSQAKPALKPVLRTERVMRVTS